MKLMLWQIFTLINSDDPDDDNFQEIDNDDDDPDYIDDDKVPSTSKAESTNGRTVSHKKVTKTMKQSTPQQATSKGVQKKKVNLNEKVQGQPTWDTTTNFNNSNNDVPFLEPSGLSRTTTTPQNDQSEEERLFQLMSEWKESISL